MNNSKSNTTNEPSPINLNLDNDGDRELVQSELHDIPTPLMRYPKLDREGKGTQAPKVITLTEEELKEKLQDAYNRGKVNMLQAIKKDITAYFDDTLISYIPH